ncbi:MAG: molybdopterin synthase catalytic subunit MoaE [Gammaproteobacteria bacterium]|nr:molybdopterin synthase catalytic subunit MoaE [Gammaproteobacteria bacterium]MBQ0838325.1 molybdopterin synthase catalytic subunit MoaE [Gammaproteobacteria bacterium]
MATPFDPGELTRQLSTSTTTCGALVCFTGLVRDQLDDPVNTLFLEHYPGMTEKALEAIVDEARGRWELGPLTIIHRVGALQPGEPIVFVGVTAAHRGEAFQACEFLMDFLKVKAPLWKKETTPDGERWVASRCSDDTAAKRWQD